jgi:glycosyltransferase involved in cell wall biosynthesis
VKKETIFINGRFLTQPITGVQRYAIEVLKSFDYLISQGNINKDHYTLVILTPQNIKYNLTLEHFEIRKVGNLKGQLWEQLELPFFSFGRLLLNLCNTAPITKSKQIVTIHDAAASANKSNYSYAFRTWYQILHHLLPLFTKQFITDSIFSKNELMKYYPIKDERIKVIYLGKEHILAQNKNDEFLKKNQLINNPYILAVSSLNPNKNFKGIIQSLKYINSNDFNLVIVGAKDIPIYKETSITSSERIKFVGYVEDDELKALYENAICFIFPSFYEGFGLPPIEAMSCGCPVIASNKASLPEVLGDSVLYCNPEDPKDIAKNIEKLVEDKQAQEYYREKGFIHSSQYSWNKCSTELFQVVEEVLQR